MTSRSVNIVVVPGEKKLIDEFDKLGVVYSTDNLAVGDAHILCDGNVEFIIERKEGRDLEASIKDGRYKEQKSRMMSLVSDTFESRRIIYLIENIPKTSSMKKSLWSSITHSQYRDGVTVFQSKNVTESAEYISSLCDAVKSCERNTTTCLSSHDANVKKKKVTPGEFYKNILTLIPGVNEIAKVIIDNYASLSLLQQAFRSSSDPANLLKDIPRPSGKMKIGGVLSARVYEYVSGL